MRGGGKPRLPKRQEGKKRTKAALNTPGGVLFLAKKKNNRLKAGLIASKTVEIIRNKAGRQKNSRRGALGNPNDPEGAPRGTRPHLEGKGGEGGTCWFVYKNAASRATYVFTLAA